MAQMCDKDIQTSCYNIRTIRTNNKMGNKTSTDASSSKTNSNTVTNEIGSVQNSSRNPFLNFLRDFRRDNSNLPAVEIVRRGAQEWHSLSPKVKRKYVIEASQAPKVERRRRKHRRRRR